MRKLALALCAVSGLVPPSFATTITFDAAPAGHVAGPITEAGFTYSELSGAIFLSSFGSSSGLNLQGFITGGGLASFVAASGGDFNFNSLDFAAYHGTGLGTQTLNVSGYLDGVLVGTDAYALASTADPNPFGNWTTEAASVLAGAVLDELQIFLDGGFDSGTVFIEAIDNVVLTPLGTAIAEPAALALLGGAVVGLALLRRRRA